MALYSDGTYRVGDYIVVESGGRGRVEDISIRSTVIRTRDDVLVTIPNSKLNSSVIVNESDPRAKYRIKCAVGIAYGSDVDRVEEVMIEAAKSVDIVLDSPNPRARFRGFGDSALEFELLCWVRYPVQRGRATHLVNRAVYQRFEEAGIEIPFPQRNVRIEGDAPASVVEGSAENG
jgi:small-conductance mechanosensitive channel